MCNTDLETNQSTRLLCRTLKSLKQRVVAKGAFQASGGEYLFEGLQTFKYIYTEQRRAVGCLDLQLY